MTDAQEPVTSKPEDPAAEVPAPPEEKVAEVPTPAEPTGEKQAEATPATTAAGAEPIATPADPEAQTQPAVAAAETNATVASTPQKTEAVAASEPVVKEPEVEEEKTAAPAAEKKPETPIKEKADIPAPAAETKPEVAVEKEVAVETPVKPAVVEDKKDTPIEAKPVEAAVEEKPIVPDPEEKVQQEAEPVSEPVEEKAGDAKITSAEQNVYEAGTPASTVLTQIPEPKKTLDGPPKTSVTLPPVSSEKEKKGPIKEETLDNLKENMPEGHSYEKVHKIFSAFDHDLNGTIAMCELADALRCCGLYVSQKEVHKLKTSLNLENHRTLDFKQFCKFLSVRKKDSVERLTKAFKRFDKHDTGYIDTVELRRCLTTMGEALTKSQVDDMLEGLNVNEDGTVEFKEFVDYMLSEQHL